MAHFALPLKIVASRSAAAASNESGLGAAILEPAVVVETAFFADEEPRIGVVRQAPVGERLAWKSSMPVIEHYKPVLNFQLSTAEQNDLVQFLKSL